MFKKENCFKVTQSEFDMIVADAKKKVVLEVENESLRTRLQEAERMIKDFKSSDYHCILEENKKLQEKIRELVFEKQNDTSGVALKTENARLKSEIEVQKAENEHLKKLVDNYRAMPDIDNIIKKLSQLAVPSIDELTKFSNALASSDIAKLVGALSEFGEKMDELLRQNYSHPRFY